MRQLILVTCMGSALWSSMAAAADVKVLSAGAVVLLVMWAIYIVQVLSGGIV